MRVCVLKKKYIYQVFYFVENVNFALLVITCFILQFSVWEKRRKTLFLIVIHLNNECQFCLVFPCQSESHVSLGFAHFEPLIPL